MMQTQLSPPEDQVSETEKQYWRTALQADFVAALHHMPDVVRFDLDSDIQELLCVV